MCKYVYVWVWNLYFKGLMVKLRINKKKKTKWLIEINSYKFAYESL